MLDDCARVSRALEGPFDERIDRSYVLEVSSPGMDRPLHTEDHFRRAVGRLIRVKTYAPVQGGRVWSGRLLACRDGVLQLETAKGILELPLDGLASARISPEYELL
jgi:ribosome maturation factor RimP